ncbi:MAG: hypothetical protein ACW98U_12965 [Candidatus Thorarchaeota archaeon]|jgi:hypothetical protein
MSFRYTVRVGYSLLILSLLTPFNVMIQAVTLDNVSIVLLAPLWQYIWHSLYPASFVLSPFALLYFPYYGLSVYVAWLAYDTSRKQHLERSKYAWRIVLAILVQIVITIIIPPYSGSPQPQNISLPIVGLVALLLTKQTVRELTSPWEKQGALSESKPFDST